MQIIYKRNNWLIDLANFKNMHIFFNDWSNQPKILNNYTNIIVAKYFKMVYL